MVAIGESEQEGLRPPHLHSKLRNDRWRDLEQAEEVFTKILGTNGSDGT